MSLETEQIPDNDLDWQVKPDAATFAAVFHRYHDALYRYAHRLTRDEDQASDIVQDVFLKLWESRRETKIHASLKAMLYRMVRNKAFNAQRRQKWYDGTVSVEHSESAQQVESLPDDQLASMDIRQKLLAWIDQLPPRCAEALVLSRFHDLKHHEIAQIMEISTRTVDTHVLLALRELRRRFDAINNRQSS